MQSNVKTAPEVWRRFLMRSTGRFGLSFRPVLLQTAFVIQMNAIASTVYTHWLGQHSIVEEQNYNQSCILPASANHDYPRSER